VKLFFYLAFFSQIKKKRERKARPEGARPNKKTPIRLKGIGVKNLIIYKINILRILLFQGHNQSFQPFWFARHWKLGVF
jgi:hypothetical protein